MRWPPSGSDVTTQRPLLRWIVPTSGTGAHVELCRDLGCTDVLESQDVMGQETRPLADLTPGIVHWRACALGMPHDRCPPWVWSFHVPRRSAPHDTAFGARPDFDRDGRSEIVVGQPNVPGTRHGLVGSFVIDPAGAPTLVGFGSIAPFFSGTDEPPNYGRSLSVAGDVVGSGSPGIIAGASGRAFVGGITPTWDDFGQGEEGFAFAVSGAGDLDQDGFADTLIGTSSDANPGTLVLITYGGGVWDSRGFMVPSGVATERYSRAVSGAGDLNGDRYSDAIIGAPGADRAYVYLGSAARPPITPPIVLDGPSGSHFGASVSCAGDVNGDGLADIVVGAPLADRAFVYLGDEVMGVTRTPIELSVAGLGAADFGSSVAGAGDVDGDDLDDVIVGAPSAALAFGRAYVFSGTATGVAATPSATLASTDLSGADFAKVVAGLGDVDGDGFDDVAIGIPGADPSQQGAVDVFRGGSGGLGSTRAWRLEGHDMGYQLFGSSIARIF